MPPRRRQGATDRDLNGMAARRERAKSPAVEFIEEEITGRYEGAELERMRSTLPPEARLRKLESKSDRQDGDIAEIKLAVADIRGDQKAQNASLTAITKTLDRMAARADVEHAADVDVEASQKKDAIAARAEKRALALKALGLLLGGGVIGKVGNMLGLW